MRELIGWSYVTYITVVEQLELQFQLLHDSGK
jgi:hypothetical protein